MTHERKNSIVGMRDGGSYLIPFILVTSLFFLWGFAHSILDVLNKHFQDVLVISKGRSGLVQAVVYGGYFLMALPAGKIMERFGYRVGVVIGLLLYGIGALMFIPGGRLMSFEFFLLSLFVIGCGLTCLETAANPYVTVLGEKESAARRLNLAQSFNGFGWICGPLVGSLLVLGEEGSSVSLPYAVIGVVVLCVAVLFSRVRLPEIESCADETTDVAERPLFSYKHFVFGVVALFFYVAAQTGINSFFINYAVEEVSGLSAKSAGLMLSFGGMGLFVVGRMLGSWVMQYISAVRLLTVCAVGAVLTMALVVCRLNEVSMAALFLCYLFESVMFPTIFAIAIKGVGRHTKRASSYLIMSIVGGAVAPVVMGVIGDRYDMATGFVVPLFCFVVILAYCLFMRGRRSIA